MTGDPPATDPIATVAGVVDAVGYLRITVDPDPAGAWWPTGPLVTDPAALADLARSTAPDRGTDRDDVALSLFVQAYAFRVASVAVGAWLLDDAVIDLDPALVSLAIDRARPNAVNLSAARFVDGAGSDTGGALGGLHRNLVDGHLAPLVANAHRAVRVGEALLWGNVGAACAASFGAFMGPFPGRRTEIRDRFAAFLTAARPELAASGRLVPVGGAWLWQRLSCCLLYRTASAATCEDCSLRSEAQRHERIERALAEVGP